MEVTDRVGVNHGAGLLEHLARHGLPKGGVGEISRGHGETDRRQRMSAEAASDQGSQIQQSRSSLGLAPASLDI